MKLWKIALLSTSMGFALPALAQFATQPQTRAAVEANLRARLTALDTDRDGSVSPDEMRAARSEATAPGPDGKRGGDQFAEIDTDHNGSISRAEFDAHHAMHHGMAGMRHDGPPMEGRADGGPPPGDRMAGDGMRDGMRGGRGAMMGMRGARGDQPVVIADAVKRALARFDAADANHDGTLTPEERQAARGAMRGRMGGANEW